ncbi:MAG: hypothetical protein ACPL7B_12320 [Candidatus Poribacteria bacterium]
MKRIDIALIIFSFIFTYSSLACVDPLDRFATEVILNKPNINYNLKPIEDAKNVIIEDGVIIYRSHFDKRIAVMLSKINADLGEGNILKGLSVKIQIPTKTVIIPYIASGLFIDYTSLNQIDVLFINSLGYEVTVEWMESQTNLYMKKGNVIFNMSQFLKVGERKLAISLVVANAEFLTDEIKSELGKIIKSLELDERVLKELEINLYKYTEGNLVEAVDIKRNEFDFKSAMKTELDWLKSNNIINGLGDDDIKVISELSEVGISGWNSRIIYAKQRWLPFYESGYGMIRDGGEGCGAFEPSRLPEGELNFSSEITNLDNKIVTKWGEIKSHLLR